MSGDTFLTRLWAVIVKPGLAAEAIKANPRFLVGGVLLLLVHMVFIMATTHITDTEMTDLTLDTFDLPAEQVAEMEENYDNLANPSFSVRLWKGTSNGIFMLVITFIWGGFLLLFCKLSGGKGRFTQTQSMVFWALAVPQLVSVLIRIPLTFVTNSSLKSSLGLAALFPDMYGLSLSYIALLLFGDFAVWWTLAILVIGLGKIHEIGTGKATFCVLLPWLLVAAAALGLVAIGFKLAAMGQA